MRQRYALHAMRCAFVTLMLAVMASPAMAQTELSYYSFDAPPEAGPDAAYRDGEVVPDDGPNDHALTVSGPGLTWTPQGRLGGAIAFDGGAGFLEDLDAYAYLEGLDALTILVWVRSNQVGTDAGIVTSDPPDDDDQNISLRYDVDGLFGGGQNVVKGGVMTENGKQEYESRSYVQATTWQHLTLIYESGKPLRLFINGAIDAPTYAPQNTNGALTNVQTLRVGQGTKATTDVWDGLIDELRIFEGVVPPEDIRTLMDEPLPVELAGVSGRADGDDLVLQWTTVSETKNAGFHVEHRPPGTASYERVGFRDGQGTVSTPTDYTFRLSDVDAGSHTVRLRQVDVDGTETLIEPVTVTVAPSEALSLSAYPSPLRSQGTVSIQVVEAMDVTVELFNVLGQRVRLLHRGRIAPGRATEIPVDASALPSGMYFVRMTTPHGSRTERLVVVQ